MLLLLAAPLAFTGCKDSDSDAINELRVEKNAQIGELLNQIDELAQEMKTIKGGTGYSPYINSTDSCWMVYNPDTKTYENSGIKAAGTNGTNGVNGKDGYSPKISENGYWMIYQNGEWLETSWPAQGEKGEKGDKGDTGAAGADGKSPYISDGYWYYWNSDSQSYIKGIKATGEDGVSHDPYIENGYWMVWDKDQCKYVSTVKATGENGENGENGHSPRISSTTGNWEVYDETIKDYKDTGVPAKGSNGSDGYSPYIGSNGNWYAYNPTTKEFGDTGIKAQGTATVIGISDDGYWTLDGVKTTCLAQGPKGEQGEKGLDGKSIYVVDKGCTDGHYWVTFSDGTTCTVGDAASGASCKCDTATYNAAVRKVYEVSDSLDKYKEITNATISKLTSDVKSLKDKIEEILDDINDLKGRATSISIDGVNNSVFGMIKTATGIQTNMLFGFYGYIEKDAVPFPSTDASYYGDKLDRLTAKELEEAGVTLPTQTIYGSGNIYNTDLGNETLGTVYYTVNPTSVDFSGIDVALVNSQNKKDDVFSLTQAEASTTVLKMGWTRPTRSTSSGFYESDVTAPQPGNVDKIDLPTSDYEAFAKSLKNDGALRSISSMATAFKNTLKAFKTDAYSVRISKTDSKTGETTVIKSPLDIQAAYVKPMSYKVANACIPDSGTWLKNKAIKAINKVVKKVIKQLQKDENMIKLRNDLAKVQNIEAITFEITPSTATILDKTYDVVLTGETGTVRVTITADELSELYDEIEDSANSSVKSINEKLVALNKVSKDGLKILNEFLSDKAINDAKSDVETLINEEWNNYFAVSYYGISYRFELALFGKNSDGKYFRLHRGWGDAYAGTKVGTSFTCYMMNLNAEMLTPAYKKHLCVVAAQPTADYTGNTFNEKSAIAAVNKSINKVYDGSLQKVTVTGLQPGVTYEFAYTGLDYTGMQETRRFYVTCK